jgi:hypothetical protein
MTDTTQAAKLEDDLMTITLANFKSMVHMKRSDFATIPQYVDAFRKQVSACEHLNTPVTPYIATILMMEELANELPSWCNAVESTFTNESPKTLTKSKFHEYCMLAIHQRIGRKMVPPPGKSLAEYLYEWRQQDTQDSEGNCAFCHLPGHSPTTCYFLIDA